MSNFETTIFSYVSQFIELNSDTDVVRKATRQILQLSSKEGFLKEEHLQKLFYVSPSLAFTIWQHAAAVDRLAENSTWIQKNQKLFNNLSTGVKSVGLAITHIVKTESPLVGERVNLDYAVSGSIPWVTGYGLFDYFVVGFRSTDNLRNIVALVPREALELSVVNAKPLELAAYQGTSTYALKISELIIQESQILANVVTGEPTRKKPSCFQIPEIGIALRCLDEVRKKRLSQEEAHALVRLESGVKKLLEDTQNKKIDLIVSAKMRDELIRDSLRLLTLVSKGASLHKDSLISVLTLQSLLLDVFVQPQDLIDAKLRSLG